MCGRSISMVHSPYRACQRQSTIGGELRSIVPQSCKKAHTLAFYARTKQRNQSLAQRDSQRNAASPQCRRGVCERRLNLRDHHTLDFRTYCDISPRLKAGGFPSSRMGIPVSRERAVASTAGLTSPPQAFAFPESQGSFSIWWSRNVVFVPIHRRAWFSHVGKRKRGDMVKHASAFTQANDLAWNPQTLFRCQCATRAV